jgi:hypothetical protein
VNRRELCAGAVLAGVAAATGSLACVLMPRQSFDTVVFDTRFEASRRFAGLWAMPTTRRGVAGDINRLWFDEIGPQWSRGGGAIAGMTTAATLFCLEQLAKDHWRRVVMRREHRTTTGPGPLRTIMGGFGAESRLVEWIIA